MLAGFGFGAAVAFYGARDGQPGAGLIFLGFAILSLASLVAEVASVQISNDSITIRYLGWQKTIAFEAITNIDLLDLQSRGNVVATVGHRTPLGQAYQADGLPRRICRAE